MKARPLLDREQHAPDGRPERSTATPAATPMATKSLFPASLRKYLGDWKVALEPEEAAERAQPAADQPAAVHERALAAAR